MTTRSISIWLHLCLVVLPILFAARAGATCNKPEFLNEREDVATIMTLENGWTSAFSRGDTEFMTCLLTPDFTEIMRSGAIYHLSDEIPLAESNRGRAAESAVMPHINVLLHDNVAVAYGLASVQRSDGDLRRNYWADYYVWKDGSWRAFFAQWTPASVPRSSHEQ